MIYFVRPKAGGHIKIGTTTRLSCRLVGLYAECGQRLDVIAVMDGGHPQERAIHRRFSHLRQSGEWFAAGSDLLDFIAHNGRPWDRSEEPQYASVRLDADVAPLARAAAILEGKSLPEWLSDIANEASAAAVKMEPISRRKPPA